jgi:curved DNA-binding protein CbpA
MFGQTINPEHPDALIPIDREYTPEEISAYYLEVEQVLGRIEQALNHYQILDLDRLATTGEIKLAYLRAVALLNPAQLGINLSVPENMLARIDPAFERISRAYSTLVNFARRMEYDASLSPRGTSPLTFNKPPRRNSREVTSPLAMASLVASAKQAAKRAELNAAAANPERPMTTPPVLEPPTGDNRRRHERFKLSVPVHVTGYDRKGGRWHEATRTVDVSRTGALLHLRKRLKKGSVLYLTMPLPVRLRTRDFQDPTYVAYSLVQRVDGPKGHATAVGVEFIGPHPPDGYLERPWDLFQPARWSGTDRRRAPRKNLSEPVILEYFTDSMECIRQETALTENISGGGLRVIARVAPSDFATVRVTSSSRGLKSFAAMCDRFIGKDGLERLCLRLLETEWPL